MPASTDVHAASQGSPPREAPHAALDLQALRTRLLAIEEQLLALDRQQSALHEEEARLRALLEQALAAAPAPPHPPANAEAVSRECAQAIVQVLREVKRPLTALELLDELGHRGRCWTSNTVRHTLAEMVDHGLVVDRHHLGACAYVLGTASPAAH